jgi:hypothetical protein
LATSIWVGTANSSPTAITKDCIFREPVATLKTKHEYLSLFAKSSIAMGNDGSGAYNLNISIAEVKSKNKRK